ncbi:MAG: TlpA disulfide reductase family protein [Acidobacteriota bacterium]
MKKLLPIVLMILILSLAACRVRIRENSPIPAPDFTLADLDGNIVSMSNFKGNVVILDFWATWCAPCRKEIPHFQKLYDTYRDQGFVMIGASFDEGGAAVVKSFLEKNNVTYPNVIANKEIEGLYGSKNPYINQVYGPIQGIPATFIINKNGEIVQKYVGETPRRVFEAHITKLLQEPTS